MSTIVSEHVKVAESSLLDAYRVPAEVGGPLREACRELAAVCDGAVQLDGAGFNATDTGSGHYLARLAVEDWGFADAIKASKILTKYSRQLLAHGIVYSELPSPPPAPPVVRSVELRAGGRYLVIAERADPDAAACADLPERSFRSSPVAHWSFPRSERADRTVSWLLERGFALNGQHPSTLPPAPAERRIEAAADGGFALYFPYVPRVVDAVKDLPGRRFYEQPRTHWWVPADARAVHALTGFADKHGFVWQADARSRADELLSVPPLPPGAIKCGEDGYRIYFDFDRGLVSEVKEIPTARFHTEGDGNGAHVWWEVKPVPEAEDALLAFAGEHPDFTGVEELAELIARRQAAVGELAGMSDAGEAAPLEVPGLLSPERVRAFQWAGVRYIMRAGGRALLGDDMGLGKTVQALVSLVSLDALPALIVCPASAKLNWQREVGKWFPELTCNVVQGRSPDPSAYWADITVLNYDILRAHADAITETVQLGSVVFDEAHYIKGHKSQRTEAALAVARRLPLSRSKSVKTEEQAAGVGVRLALTGTPFKNRPSELIPLLNMLGKLDYFGGFWHFAHTYCGATQGAYGLDLSGATHQDELHELLRRTVMVRRLKSEVLTELPAKQWVTVPLELGNRKVYDHAREEFIDWLREQASNDKRFQAALSGLSAEEKERLTREHANDEEAKARRAEQLVRIGKLRQVAVEGKLEQAIEWIRTALESDGKLIVFAYHRDVQQALLAAFPESEATPEADALKVAHVFGDDSPAQRQAAVDAFQSEPECRLIVCSLMAAGEAITLTAAQNVVFLEQGWNPATMEQALDRAHRIGQRGAVVGWNLVAHDTIEDWLAELIEQKRSVVSSVVDGGQPEPAEPDHGVVNSLIGRLLGGEAIGKKRKPARAP